MGHLVTLRPRCRLPQGYAHRRLWLEMGVPLTIAPRMIATLTADRHGEGHTIYCFVQSSLTAGNRPFQDATWLDLTPFGAAGLYAQLAAIEYGPFNYAPARALIEFVWVRRDSAHAAQ